MIYQVLLIKLFVQTKPLCLNIIFLLKKAVPKMLIKIRQSIF